MCEAPAGPWTAGDGGCLFGSLQGYLDALTDSLPLKAVLSAANPLYGIAPADCPLYVVHFLVMDSFVQGAWRLDEDRGPLAGAFVAALWAAGGEVRCRARVAAIESANGAVRAVRLADGDRLEAKRVVFTGHPKQLLFLCDEGALRPAFRQRLLEQPETAGIFGVAIAWAHPECSLLRRNVVIYSGLDSARQYHQPLVRQGEAPHALVCNAQRSSAGTAGADVPAVAALALAPVRPEDWAPWGESRTGQRPADYAAAKRQLAEQTLAALRATWPGAAGGMRVVETFSPLTLRDHTLNPAGSAYGLRKSAAVGQGGRMLATTRLKGLFLAGQSIILPGVVCTVDQRHRRGGDSARPAASH